MKQPAAIRTDFRPGRPPVWRLLVRAGVVALLLAVGRPAPGASPAGAAAEGTGPVEEEIDWARAREFWSFRSPHASQPPPVRNKRWVRSPLDAFVLAALEANHLSPSFEADRRSLIRRVTYDLTGLPPTVEEVNAFLRDTRPDAYEEVVDRLLASPRLGERLASLWLNVSRYAEDQAHQVGDDVKSFYPNAWRYRDWVIRAFNQDLPYDQFVRLQLAADKLPAPAGNGATNRNTNTQADVGNLPALGFLGLGPKYYDRERLAVMADEWEDRVDTVARTFLGLTVACARCHDHKYDPITMRDYYALAGVFASTRMVSKAPGDKPEELPAVTSGGKEKKAAAEPAPDTLHVVEDGPAQNLPVFLRGNVDRKGPLAPRRFLQVLEPPGARPFEGAGSGREQLAEALVRRDNPLTARVMVNRLWALMYGRGLVATPSNFGANGLRPTHPGLLDDLAVRFVDHGWSVKGLLREMALSATYRQSSRRDPARQALDPDNQQLWRMPRRRLPVEMWRDSMLAVTGELDGGTQGGRSVDLDAPENHRRTVYGRISRLKLSEVLLQFDYPDANVHAEKRSVTTTAMQKLFVLNSPFLLSRARGLAASLAATAEPGEENRVRMNRAYERLYSRPATAEEIALGQAFLETAPAGSAGWEQYAQMLLAANEMMYVD